MTDPRWLDDLDAAWDAETRGGGHPASLDAATSETLTRLSSLQRAADAPLAGRSRVWTAPSRPTRRFRLAPPRFRALHAYALVALLLLVTLTGAFSLARDERPAIASATSIPALGGQKLYRIDGVTGAWQAMDPTTLADIPGDSTPGIQMNAGIDAYLNQITLVSGDGSTLVQWVSSKSKPSSTNSDHYVIYDARTMQQKGVIAPAHDTSVLAVSNSGDRLILSQYTPVSTHVAGVNETTTIETYATSTGALISTIDLTLNHPFVLGAPVVDSTGTRAYVVSMEMSKQDENPGTAYLTGYDLTRGAKIGEVPLSSVVTIQSSSSATPDPFISDSSVLPLYYQPGIALSADDQTLAIVPGDGTKIVLVNAGDFSQRTIKVARQDGSSCFPGVTPRFTRPAFSGDHMIVNGWVMVDSVLSEGTSIGVALLQSGTCSVDLATGTAVFRSAEPMLPANWYQLRSGVFPAGDSYYVVGVSNRGEVTAALGSTPESAHATYGIFRFNATTLELEASKTYEITDPHAFTGGFLLSLVPPS